jgi:hypothetical protein
MNKLKAERDLERANSAFASLDSDESGRYDASYNQYLNNIVLFRIGSE